VLDPVVGVGAAARIWGSDLAGQVFTDRRGTLDTAHLLRRTTDNMPPSTRPSPGPHVGTARLPSDQSSVRAAPNLLRRGSTPPAGSELPVPQKGVAGR
jgi:hypothetical protein